MPKIDILNRDEFVDQLVHLIDNIADANRKKTSDNNQKNTTFALDGTWGCGKSFVLDMLEEQLNIIQSEDTYKEKYFVIRYNCWKYDYYQEPLVAIVAAMIDIINQKTKLWNDETKKARFIGILKAIGSVLASAANANIAAKTGFDFKSGLKKLKSSIDAEQENVQESHEYDDFYSFNQVLQCLQSLIQEISTDQTVVFLVDELDRCLPEYAIKVLERLHHLTEGSENTITVLSMDKTRLQTSIQHIFGFDAPEKYLEKFISFEVKLDCGTVSEQVMQKYTDFVDLFEQGSFQFEDSKEEFFQTVFSGIDVRTQEKLIQRATIAHKLLFAEKKDYVFMCMELLLTVMVCIHNHTFDKAVNFGPNKDCFKYVLFDSSSVEKRPKFADLIKRKVRIYDFQIQQMFPDEEEILILPHNSGLYGAILLLWCSMHPRNKKYSIGYDKNSSFQAIADYYEELRKFVDTISVII